MGIIKYKPTTNGRRNMTSSDFAEITKTTPEKTLLESQSHTAGRNAHGHITVRHRGGGHKQYYRVIDSSVLRMISKRLLSQSNMIQIEHQISH
mgnify:CR=1 FL=1